uniref:Uncharacterized protein n=1 Tax=Myoviridae sp. ctY1522 TaxID=2825124 RepID=A0A8S5TQW1_9CAUD|nr:MAG TPA: hypothetical protein [Myoviridae sp. ctY1522]
MTIRFRMVIFFTFLRCKWQMSATKRMRRL